MFSKNNLIFSYYKVAGSDTRTSAALKKAGELFFKPGTIGNRKDIDDIAILLTDGRSNDGYNVNAPFIKVSKTLGLRPLSRFCFSLPFSLQITRLGLLYI